MINKTLKFFLLSAGLLVSVGIILLIKVLFGLNIVPAEKEIILFIPESASYSQAMDSIKVHIPIQHPVVFDWIAKRKNYPANVKPGRYVIKQKISYIEAINMFRSGDQAPVNVTFNNVRTIYDLAGKIGGQISADSSAIIAFLSDSMNYYKEGFNQENIISVFTIQIPWNVAGKIRRYW